MNWFRRKPQAESVAVAVVEPPRVQKRPVAQVGCPDEIENYVTLCKKIGAETPAVRMLQLKQFLANRGIPEYDAADVHAYLLHLVDKKVKENPRGWYHISWVPLRESDKGILFDWFWGSDEKHAHIDVQLVSNRVYHELVPQSVLATVDVIMEQFSDAKFFVTDLTQAKIVDPFLGVTFEGQKLIIVDFWDEPGFRPTK